MNYWRCECGEVQWFESGMMPRDCQGCRKCGTTLGMNPRMHKPVQPHKPEVRYDERTGEKSHCVCTECYERLPLEALHGDKETHQPQSDCDCRNVTD